MYAKFIVNGKTERFFVHTFGNRISIYDENNVVPDWEKEPNEDFPDTKWKYTELKKDENGYKYFTIGDSVYHFSDAVMCSMAEIKERIDKQEQVLDDEIMWAIIHDGVENVRFLMEMPIPDMIVPELGIALIGDKCKKIPVKLVEEFNTHVYDNYKLKFIPDIDLDDEYICNRRTYASDIYSMIKSGIIEILPSISENSNVDEYFKNAH